MRNEIGEIVVRGNLEPSTFSASRIAVRRRGEAGPLPPPDDAPEVAGQAEGGERRYQGGTHDWSFLLFAAGHSIAILAAVHRAHATAGTP